MASEDHWNHVTPHGLAPSSLLVSHFLHWLDLQVQRMVELTQRQHRAAFDSTSQRFPSSSRTWEDGSYEGSDQQVRPQLLVADQNRL